MDIVYIFNGWKTGEEMRYSMRSIAKYGRNVGQVYVLGHRPQWCNPATVREIVYNSDSKLYKENDITAAIMKAAEVPELSTRFLICADDYFYIRETDFDNYPIYLKNPKLPHSFEAGGNNPRKGGINYRRSAVNTRALLTAAGLPIGNYSQHACFPADKKLMAEFAHLFRAALLLEYGALFDSLMANIIIDKTDAVVVPRKDNKIRTARDRAELLQLIGDTEVWSSSERHLDYGLLRILQTDLPEKCKYEL